MSIEETYEWAKKQREAWDRAASKDPSLASLSTELSQGGDHPIEPVAFVKVEKDTFVGEVGRVEGDLFFHFFPKEHRNNKLVSIKEDESVDVKMWVFGDEFADKLGDAFLEVFKFEDKLCWDFVPEMNSWVVRAFGYADNPNAEELSSRLFDLLQETTAS